MVSCGVWDAEQMEHQKWGIYGYPHFAQVLHFEQVHFEQPQSVSADILHTVSGTTMDPWDVQEWGP